MRVLESAGADPGGFKGFHGTPLLKEPFLLEMLLYTIIEQSNRNTLIEQSQ